jgi:hypothetical protein
MKHYTSSQRIKDIHFKQEMEILEKEVLDSVLRRDLAEWLRGVIYK